jgi:hypothetical protein
MIGGFNMQQMMRQAEQLKKQMEEGQKKLKTEMVSATVGGGMVEAIMNGEGRLQSIKINPAVVDADDVETLEDLVVSAVNQARAQADELKERVMGPMGGAGGLF